MDEDGPKKLARGRNVNRSLASGSSSIHSNEDEGPSKRSRNRRRKNKVCVSAVLFCFFYPLCLSRGASISHSFVTLRPFTLCSPVFAYSCKNECVLVCIRESWCASVFSPLLVVRKFPQHHLHFDACIFFHRKQMALARMEMKG